MFFSEKHLEECYSNPNIQQKNKSLLYNLLEKGRGLITHFIKLVEAFSFDHGEGDIMLH